jgi:hypothetical protein
MKITKLTKAKDTSVVLSKTKTRDLVHILIKDNVSDVFQFKTEENRKKIILKFVEKAKNKVAKNSEGLMTLNEELFVEFISKVLYSKISTYEKYETVESATENLTPLAAQIGSFTKFIESVEPFTRNLIKDNGISFIKGSCETLYLKLFGGYELVIQHLGEVKVTEGVYRDSFKYEIKQYRKMLYNVKY